MAVREPSLISIVPLSFTIQIVLIPFGNTGNLALLRQLC